MRRQSLNNTIGSVCSLDETMGHWPLGNDGMLLGLKVSEFEAMKAKFVAVDERMRTAFWKRKKKSEVGMSCAIQN